MLQQIITNSVSNLQLSKSVSNVQIAAFRKSSLRYEIQNIIQVNKIDYYFK